MKITSLFFLFSIIVLFSGYTQYAEANHPESGNVCGGKCIAAVQDVTLLQII